MSYNYRTSLRLAVCWFVLAGVARPGCGGATEPPGTTGAELILAYPEISAELLLGHAVVRHEDGTITIAPEGVPGCRFDTERADDVKMAISDSYGRQSLAVASGRMGQYWQMAARAGRDLQLQLDATVEEAYVAKNWRGCEGREVIAQVYLGHGRRAFMVQSGVGVKAEGPSNTPQLTMGGEAKTERHRGTSIDFQEGRPLAFMVRTTKVNSEANTTWQPPLKLELSFESATLAPDEPLQLSLTSNRNTQFIAFYADQFDRGQVLYPSPRVTRPKIEQNTPLLLPTPEERAAGEAIYAAQPPDGQEKSYGYIYVFATTEPELFVQLDPQAQPKCSEPRAANENLGAAAYLQCVFSTLHGSRHHDWAAEMLKFEVHSQPAANQTAAAE